MHLRCVFTVCNSSLRWTYDVTKCTRTNIASVAVYKSYFSGGPFTSRGRFAPLYPTCGDDGPVLWCIYTGLILGLRPANERRRYSVTTSLIAGCKPRINPDIYITRFQKLLDKSDLIDIKANKVMKEACQVTIVFNILHVNSNQMNANYDKTQGAVGQCLLRT